MLSGLSLVDPSDKETTTKSFFFSFIVDLVNMTVYRQVNNSTTFLLMTFFQISEETTIEYSITRIKTLKIIRIYLPFSCSKGPNGNRGFDNISGAEL